MYVIYAFVLMYAAAFPIAIAMKYLGKGIYAVFLAADAVLAEADRAYDHITGWKPTLADSSASRAPTSRLREPLWPPRRALRHDSLDHWRP